MKPQDNSLRRTGCLQRTVHSLAHLRLPPCFFLLWCLLSCCTGCFFDVDVFSFSTGPSHATIAEDLHKEGKVKEAIAEYEQHVSDRLASKRRLPDENPYFYYLLIGDLYLEIDDPAAARTAYERALAENVEPRLTSARLRRLGQWYEEKGRYEEALEVLKKYRELDPAMYNLDIDRVHKATVRREQEEENEPQ